MSNKKGILKKAIEQSASRARLRYLYGGRFNKEREVIVSITDNLFWYGNYSIPLENIQGYSMKHEDQVFEHMKSRLTATRLVLLGPFALAAPKRKIQKNRSVINYLLIDCIDDGSETTIVFSGQDSAKIFNVLKQHLPNVNQSNQPNHSKEDNSLNLDPYSEIKKLKELLDLDIISKEEYESKRKELLGL